MLKEMLKRLGPEFGFLAEEMDDVEKSVLNRLDRSVKLDEIDTVTFGLETDDGKIVKVYVKADQAEDFEKALSDKLGEIDDIEEVLNELAKEYEIVDVEWPSDDADADDDADDAETDGSEAMDPKVYDNDKEKSAKKHDLKAMEGLNFGELATIQVNEDGGSIESRFTTAAQLMVYHAILQLGVPEVALTRNSYRAAIIKNVKNKALELQHSAPLKNALKLFINRSIDYDAKAEKNAAAEKKNVKESINDWQKEMRVELNNRFGPSFDALIKDFEKLVKEFPDNKGYAERLAKLKKDRAELSSRIGESLAESPEPATSGTAKTVSYPLKNFQGKPLENAKPGFYVVRNDRLHKDADHVVSGPHRSLQIAVMDRSSLADPSAGKIINWKPMTEALLTEGPVQDFWEFFIKLVNYLSSNQEAAKQFLNGTQLKQLMTRSSSSIPAKVTSQLRQKMNDLKNAMESDTDQAQLKMAGVNESSSPDEVVDLFKSMLTLADPSKDGSSASAVMKSSYWNQFFNSVKGGLSQKFNGQLRQKLNSFKAAMPGTSAEPTTGTAKPTGSQNVGQSSQTQQSAATTEARSLKNAELAHDYKHGNECFDKGYKIEVIGEDAEHYFVKPFAVMKKDGTHLKMKKSEVKLTGKINVPIGGPGGDMPGGLNGPAVESLREEAPPAWSYDTEDENTVIQCANLKISLNPEETEKLVKGITNRDAVIVRDDEDTTHKVAFSPRGSSVMVKKVGTADGLMMKSRDVDDLLDFISGGEKDDESKAQPAGGSQEDVPKEVVKEGTDFHCSNCGENLGKDTQLSTSVYCGNCGTGGQRNSHGSRDDQPRGDSSLVGKWTFPYKKPRGTKAAQVKKVVGDIVHLSDGTSMHKSHFRPVDKNAVVPG